MHSSPRH